LICLRSPFLLRVLSVFSLLCVLCNSASATGFLYVDDAGGAVDTVVPEISAPIGVDDPVYALGQSPMAVMSAAAVSDTAEWHIEKTGRQYFGFSTRYTGQWASMGPVTKDVASASALSSGAILLATYTNSDNMKSTIAYQAPEEFYVDVYKDVAISENDTAYIYVNGNPNLYLQVYNGFGSFLIEPTSIHVLVNDSEYVSDIEPGSVVRQEIPLGAEFPEITKAGFRFYFGVREAQKDVGTVSDKVYYQILPRIGNMSITTSDQATGLLSGILGFLQSIYNAIVSFLGSIVDFVSAILDVLRSIWDFVASSVSGIIRIFVLIAQSMVFLRNVIGLLPSVLLVFSVLGLLISIFLFFLGR